MQDLNGIFVFNVAEREHIDRPTARLIKEFDYIEGNLYSNYFALSVLRMKIGF